MSIDVYRHRLEGLAEKDLKYFENCYKVYFVFHDRFHFKNYH